MLKFDSPGVYIQEVESGAKPIEIAGTSTAAFLGYAQTGEAMKPVQLESYEQFVERFGGISETGLEDHDPLSLGVRAFFQNGGRRAYIVNVASGGHPAGATVVAGRNQNPVTLFTVRSKYNSSALNHLVVYLTPKIDPRSGLFDFEIVENTAIGPRVIESYRSVTLAPGLPSSLEEVVRNSESRFEVVLDPGLGAIVFPRTDPVARAGLRGAVGQLNVKVMNGAALALNVSWSAAPGTPDGDVAALNEALKGLALPAGIQVRAEKEDATDVVFVVKSAFAEATVSVWNGATKLVESQKDRGTCMQELITGFDGINDLPQAALSGAVDLDPTRLAGTQLDVRFGGGVARRVEFPVDVGVMSAEMITSIIEVGLKGNDRPPALQSLTFEVRNERLVIGIGADAPSGAHLSDETMDGGTKKPLFRPNADQQLESPRILDADATMTVHYTEGGNPAEPAQGKTVTLSKTETLEACKGRLAALTTPGGDALLDISIQNGFTLRLKAMDSNRPVTFTDENADSLAAILNLEEIKGTWKKATPVATPADLIALAQLTFRLTEDGVANPLDVSVPLPTGANKITSAAALQEHLQSALGSATDGANVDVHVEVIKDQYLLWDPTQHVTVLEPGGVADSAAALLSLTQATGVKHETLNRIQGNLALVATLSQGKSGPPGGLAEYKAALKELESVPAVSIICLPGQPWDKGDGPSYQFVEAAIMHAERQQDRMVIVDPPKPNGGNHKWRDRAGIQLAKLPTSSYAAIYYPWAWVHVPSATPGIAAKPQEVLVAPSGIAAGVWSWMDRERGVWKAPAGVDARVYGVSRFDHELTDAEGGALNREGVNALRTLRGWGSIVWGARTAATNAEPQWKYLPVRRTAILIEDSLREALAWAVHQPNRPTLWSALRLNIEVFLNRLFQAGAFQADNPREAYFVECGLNTTMSQADIDAGVIRVRVGIAPSKPAEFVVITIEQINEQG